MPLYLPTNHKIAPDKYARLLQIHQIIDTYTHRDIFVFACIGAHKNVIRIFSLCFPAPFFLFHRYALESQKNTRMKITHKKNAERNEKKNVYRKTMIDCDNVINNFQRSKYSQSSIFRFAVMPKTDAKARSRKKILILFSFKDKDNHQFPFWLDTYTRNACALCGSKIRKREKEKEQN